jgi:FAD/FMN-containing dehydrogenase
VAGFSQHISAVGELVSSLYRAGSAVRRPPDPADPSPGVEDINAVFEQLALGGLGNVVSVDVERQTAVVQGRCTVARLAQVVLARGLVPQVVPAPGSLKVGGGIVRPAVGSESWRTGPFTEAVISVDVLTTSGMMQTARPDAESGELFAATLNGQAATGVITAAEVRLGPAAPFVATRAIGCAGASGLQASLEEATGSGSLDGAAVDFCEAVSHPSGGQILSLGRRVDSSEAQTLAVEPSRYGGRGPSYFETLVPGARDLMTMADYLTRWDADEFWRSFHYGLGAKLVRRLWPPALRGAPVYSRIDALLDARRAVRSIEQAARWRPGPARVYREVMVPLEHLAELLERLAGLAPGVPVWSCPVRLDGAMWVYCGIWGAGAHRAPAHNLGVESAIDRATGDLAGRTVRTAG